ncbi:MAG: hypothetical protein JSV21_01190 [Nitrospirota bacterium]|nr:MAG: hypothetical protein JSV21_01190 [Nitrospirota bacterium]
MKRYLIFVIAISLIYVAGGISYAGEYKFSYKLDHGDVLMAKEASEMRSSVMGTESVTRTKRTVRYKVSKGPKKGWVKMSAEVLSQVNQMDKEPANRQNTLKGMVFVASVHKSGEVRDYKFSGGDPQIAQYVGPAMKYAIFRFPEFPETALDIGDEFDVVQKMEMPGMQGIGGMKATTKLTYTLEDVNKGLAYFSVRSRTSMEGSGMEMKDAGKSEAIFDMKEGMWIEHETRSKSQIAAGFGSGGYTVNVSKMEIEKK